MSAPDRLRLFAALELPAEATAALEDFRDRAAEPALWRPVAADSLHVTLAFLGATDPALVEPLGAGLEAVAGPAPRLRLAGALLLPPRRARVLCAALDDPDTELAALQARLSEALAATGAYAPEARPFRPHVTVARLRRGLAAPRVVDELPEPIEFHGDALTLFASRLSPSGSRYQPLARVPLPH
jgi:2'-5' RNA ligase